MLRSIHGLDHQISITGIQCATSNSDSARMVIGIATSR
jgi:hypothetical protein